MSITSALWISPRTRTHAHRHRGISRSPVWPCSWCWRHVGDISDEFLFYSSRDVLITPAAAQISIASVYVKLTLSECMLRGVFLTFASWPVLMEELMCACVWTNRIPRAGRAVCVGEFCSCSFCVSESEPFAPAPVGHPQARPLPRWASWWACSHPPGSWVAGRDSSTRTQACVCERRNEKEWGSRLH